MGIESFIGKEVPQSAKNLFKTRSYEDKKGLFGNTVDQGTDVLINMIKEPIRLTTLGITGIMGYTSGKIMNVLGSTLKLGARAALSAIKLPFPTMTDLRDMNTAMDAGITTSKLRELRVALERNGTDADLHGTGRTGLGTGQESSRTDA